MKLKTLILTFIVNFILGIILIVLFWIHVGIKSPFSLAMVPLILIFWILGIIVLGPLSSEENKNKIKHIFEIRRQFLINGLFLGIGLIIALFIFLKTDFTFPHCAIISTIVVFGRWIIFVILNLIFPSR